MEEAPQPLAAPSIRDVDGITENGVGFTVFGASGNEVELQYSTSDLFTDPLPYYLHHLIEMYVLMVCRKQQDTFLGLELFPRTTPVTTLG